MTSSVSALEQAKETFVGQWGALASSWGINRTMAQIHALLLVSDEPLCTDDVMAQLSISRGNANTNLRELVGWGLLRSVVIKGDRKEYFAAEKDVWKLFCTVARERKRRELAPVVGVLRQCVEMTRSLKSREAKAFTSQLTALADFVDMVNSVIDKVVMREQSRVVPALLKLLS